MIIKVIDAGNFKLDGGAMFGVVPKLLWNKLVPADLNNLCTWKMRCLLIEHQNRLILIDTGIGNKQEQKWLNHYHIHGEADLCTNLLNAGYHPNDITDVILTHLHFDHAGGAVSLDTSKSRLVPTFENAKYWTHSDHWQWAMHPNPREKSTFLKENLMPLSDQNRLHFIDKEDFGLNQVVSFIYHNGHTEKMILPSIVCKNQNYLFAADSIPSLAHIKIPYVMSYDIRPLETMIEKEQILKMCAKDKTIIIFDHDATFEAASIVTSEQGYEAKNLGSLKDFF